MTPGAIASVEAVIVNHNTSPFAELCLRSLRATQAGSERPHVAVTVVDNHSDDDGLAELIDAAAAEDAGFVRSPWPAAGATVNTHGDVLRDFVLSRPDPDAYLLLDADIVFIEAGTVTAMASELEARPELWAVQARFASAERRKGAGASIDIGAGHPMLLYTGLRDPDEDAEHRRAVRGVGQPRCHPGCTLVRNTPALRRVAATIGFHAAIGLSQDESRAGYYDTMALASAVMATHELHYALAATEVVHYFNVSYDHRSELTAAKLDDCRQRLALLRSDPRPQAPPPPGPWGPWGEDDG